MLDLDALPVIRARWFTNVVEPRAIRVIVIHDMEFPERMSAAEDVARYFANPLDSKGRPVKASAHLCIDSDSIVRCVDDNDVAYAAPGCNSDGLQFELAGYGSQNIEQWLDPFGVAMMNLAAEAAALYSLSHDIPLVQLTDNELRNGARGIVGHAQVSRVYKKSDHTDPGDGFPWEYFIGNCNERLAVIG